MAIVTSYNGFISINGVDLSNHVKSFTLSYSQETRDVSAMGNTQRNFRAGINNVALEVDFYHDLASASVYGTLNGLVSVTSTGFTVISQSINPSTLATTGVNPKFTFTGIIDGDLNLLPEEHGEVGIVSAKFVPYSGTLTISTSAT